MKISLPVMAALGLTPGVHGVVHVFHSIAYSIAPVISTGLSVQPKPYPIQCGQLDNAVPNGCTVDGNTGTCSTSGYTVHIHALGRYNCNNNEQRPSDGESISSPCSTTRC